MRAEYDFRTQSDDVVALACQAEQLINSGNATAVDHAAAGPMKRMDVHLSYEASGCPGPNEWSSARPIGWTADMLPNNYFGNDSQQSASDRVSCRATGEGVAIRYLTC
jgi:hypothetical protein